MEEKFKLETIAEDLEKVRRSFAYMMTVTKLNDSMNEYEIGKFIQASNEFIIENLRESEKALDGAARTDTLSKLLDDLAGKTMDKENIKSSKHYV